MWYALVVDVNSNIDKLIPIVISYLASCSKLIKTAWFFFFWYAVHKSGWYCQYYHCTGHIFKSSEPWLGQMCSICIRQHSNNVEKPQWAFFKKFKMLDDMFIHVFCVHHIARLTDKNSVITQKKIQSRSICDFHAYNYGLPTQVAMYMCNVHLVCIQICLSPPTKCYPERIFHSLLDVQLEPVVNKCGNNIVK